jgi:hypothetical protein
LQTSVARWDMKRNNYYLSNLIVYIIGCNYLIIMIIITLSKVIKHLYQDCPDFLRFVEISPNYQDFSRLLQAPNYQQIEKS